MNFFFVGFLTSSVTISDVRSLDYLKNMFDFVERVDDDINVGQFYV